MKNEDNKAERNATIVDPNWGIGNNSGNAAANDRVQSNGDERNATIVDPNWGIGNNSGNAAANIGVQSNGNERNATIVDDTWGGLNKDGYSNPVTPQPNTSVSSLLKGIDMSDPYAMMRSAKADAFSSTQDFLKAVSQLTEITSRSNNRYRLIKPIFQHGGEAVIYLCRDDQNNDAAAKIYFKPVESGGSSVQARVSVLQYMGTYEGQKYTLPILETGLVQLGGSLYYFEIMPYIESGNVTNQRNISFSDLVEITRDLNEALHSIHEFGLIHRDIKPDNIYKYNGRYVIGDFGVAMTAINGITKGTKFHIGTLGYTAPEINMVVTKNPIFVYDTRSDYYSLGPTLGTLFEGHDIYAGMNGQMIGACVREGKLPLFRQEKNRDKLEKLLNGLCSFDAKRRFDYDDVNQWLLNHDYEGGYNKNWEQEFPFKGEKINEKYSDEMSLFNGITQDREHWNLGKDMLYHNYFEDFFRKFKIELTRAAQMAREAWVEKDRDKGLAVFLKDLYAPGPIVWKGYTFKSLEELGEKMIVTKTPEVYAEILQEECISHWLENTEGINADEETIKLVSQIEKHSRLEPSAACYWFGNCFAQHKRTSVCGRVVNDVGSFIRVLFNSPEDFYFNDGLSKFLDAKKGADLYGFLYSFGFKDLAAETTRNFGNIDEFEKTCYVISMLDTVADKSEGADVSIVRNFFVKYGPIGATIYAQQLAQQSDNPIYQALDNEGKNILNQIISFKIPNVTSVSELFNAYVPLMKHIETMRVSLTDNPFLVSSGAYENKGVVCTNLAGSFAFDFLGRKAPLGFCSFLENANGGGK